MEAVVSPRRWALWTQPPRLIAYSLLAVGSAAAATIAAAWLRPVTPTDLMILAALAIAGVAEAELSRNVERMRRRIATGLHINVFSVWLLAAVLLLPPVLLAALTAVLFGQQLFRIWHTWYRRMGLPAFRKVVNIAITILTGYLTQAAVVATGVDGAWEAVDRGWTGIAVIALSIVTYFVANAILFIPFIGTAGRGLRELLGSWADNLLELATLCLGALTAVAMASLPTIVMLVVPPLFLLHRTVLVSQLESAVRRDGKTGVWNVAGWYRIAHEELARARRTATTLGVLMIDVDHFKRINDGYGHLAGDAVLKAVADAISDTVRVRDSVGRFGGEEFVVLLPELTEADVTRVAERIRQSITRLEVTAPGEERAIGGLSVSIGSATYPSAGREIDRLVHAADQAMYRAKANGRNQVSHHAAQVGS